MRKAIVDAWTPWRARLDGLSARERRLLLGAGVAIALGLAYLSAKPMLEYRQEAVLRQAREFQALVWMRDNRAAAAARARADAETSQARMSTINAAARAVDLPLRRIQPEADGFSVQIDRQAFGKVVRWTTALEDRHGVEIVRASIDLDEPGVVNARFSLR